MEAELKEKWVKALRSGRYKQTVGVLSDTEAGVGEENCCLGVLCRVARIPRKLWEDEELLENLCLSDGTDLLDFFDLSLVRQRVLADLNDGGDTFGDIADYIEKNL